jgi:2,4-dienoyl-CoA reductase (NADPH2)
VQGIEIGGAVGLETAHFLAEIGTLDAKQLRFLLNYKAETAENLYNLASKGSKEITVVEMLKGLGRDIGVSSRWILMSNLKRGKVTLMDEAKVLNVTAKGVNVDYKGEQRFIEADTIILAVGSRADNGLFEQLKEFIPAISIIGDAVKPAKVTNALEIAYDAAGLLPVYQG